MEKRFFLLEKKANDGRKKLNEIIDSYDKVLELFEWSEYESDSYSDESSRNDKEYSTDEDYGFERGYNTLYSFGIVSF